MTSNIFAFDESEPIPRPMQYFGPESFKPVSDEWIEEMAQAYGHLGITEDIVKRALHCPRRDFIEVFPILQARGHYPQYKVVGEQIIRVTIDY